MTHPHPGAVVPETEAMRTEEAPIARLGRPGAGGADASVTTFLPARRRSIRKNGFSVMPQHVRDGAIDTIDGRDVRCR